MLLPFLLISTCLHRLHSALITVAAVAHGNHPNVVNLAAL